MKFKPIKYLKCLGWNKEDVKKTLMFIIMLLIACFIFNRCLLVKVRIIQRGWHDSLSIDGSVDIDGSVNADVSGSVSTY